MTLTNSTNPAQLPLPFQSRMTASLAPPDRQSAVTVLAQLLLAAAAAPGGQDDE